jgi:hypothetical protein
MWAVYTHSAPRRRPTNYRSRSSRNAVSSKLCWLATFRGILPKTRLCRQFGQVGLEEVRRGCGFRAASGLWFSAEHNATQCVCPIAQSKFMPTTYSE